MTGITRLYEWQPHDSAGESPDTPVKSERPQSVLAVDVSDEGIAF
jgi:hypothetical protein